MISISRFDSLGILLLLTSCLRESSCLVPAECTSEQECCNGLPNLCEVPVNEILFGMVHNAMSSPSAGFVFFANHLNDPIVESLDTGYRGLSLDLCNCNGDLEFCHGGDEVGCGVGRRDPVETFSKLNDWLMLNPRDVLMIYLEINEDAGGPISLDDVQSILRASNGFLDRLYVHNPDEEWPRLKDLIDNDKRVLLFYIRGPEGSGDHPPGINFFHDYAMSTDWSYESVEDLEERTLESCTINRAGPRRDFFLMNNVVTKNFLGFQFVPSQDAAEEINTIEFAQPLLEACEEFHGKKVNIISVDFWKSGNLPELIQLHNSALVSATTNPSSSSPVSALTESPAIVSKTDNPSSVSSVKPSETPSGTPSQFRSTSPSSDPSGSPSQAPSWTPSGTPSFDPSDVRSSLMQSRPPSLVPSEMTTNVNEESSSAKPREIMAWSSCWLLLILLSRC